MLVNLTPHRIVIRPDGGAEIVLEPSGTVARVEADARGIGTLDGVPVVRTVYGRITGLPAPVAGTTYVVSSLVAQALAADDTDRTDVVAPDTGPESAVRDEAGRIVAVRRFQWF